MIFDEIKIKEIFFPKIEISRNFRRYSRKLPELESLKVFFLKLDVVNFIEKFSQDKSEKEPIFREFRKE
jgi:hypothetical protein